MRNSIGVIVFGLIGFVFVAFNSLFIVHQTDQALVTQFGELVRVVSEPGLAFKAPFIQNVTYMDKRILELDADPEEVIASDRRRIVVDAFAIPDFRSFALFPVAANGCAGTAASFVDAEFKPAWRTRQAALCNVAVG